MKYGSSFTGGEEQGERGMREGKGKKKERKEWKRRRGEGWHTHTKRRWLFNIAPNRQNLQKEKGCLS